MAITSSAKKAYRASLRKRVFNLRRKKAVIDVVKELKTLVSEKNGKGATAILPRAYKVLDKAVKGGTIRKGEADRRKSRLARLVKTAC